MISIVSVFAGQPQLFDGFNWMNSAYSTGTVKTKLLLPGAVADSGPARVAIDAVTGEMLYDLGTKFGVQYLNKTVAFATLPGVPLCLKVSGWNSIKQQEAYAANVTLKSIYGVKALAGGGLLDYTYTGLVRDITSCEDYIATTMFGDRITGDLEQWEADQFIPLPRVGPLPPGIPGSIISAVDINLSVRTSGRPPASVWTTAVPELCKSPYTTVDFCSLFKSGPLSASNGVAKRDIALPNGLTALDLLHSAVRNYYNV